ncbi:MAG: TonB-dependent receptor [candidate division WOR-3 bacterium]
MSQTIHKTIFLLSLPIILIGQTRYEVDTIFVTASRVEEPISRVPLHTSLINRDVIILKNFGDIGSVLYTLPGTDVRSYSIIGGASSVNLFGSSSQQVLVLLDGRPLNSMNLGVANLGLLPTANLKKIEVVNGPISSLYGANALGGVINFLTQSPLDFTESGAYYDIALLYGTYNTNRIYLGTGFAHNHFSVLVNANQENSTGYRTNDDCLKQSVGLKLGYQSLINQVRLDFDIQTKANGLPGPKPADTLIPFYGDSTASSIFDRTLDTVFSVRGEWKQKLRPDVLLQLTPFFAKNWTRFRWVDAYSLDTALYQDRYISQNTGTNLIVNYQGLTGIRINGGIDFRQDDFQAESFLYNEMTGQYRDTAWQAKAHRVGIFGEGNIMFGKIMIFVPSLRLDWNSDFGNFLSPSFGVLFPLNSQVRLRTHIGRAFRAPTFNDLYWPKSGNPKIKPEHGDALQFGIDLKFPNSASFSLTGFARRTKNLIAWVPDTAGLWRPTNIDETEIFGITTNGKIKFPNGFAFNYTGNWLKAKQIRQEMVYFDWLTNETRFERTKRRAAYLPEFSAIQEIGYETKFATNLSLELRETGNRVNYYSSYDSLPKVYMTTKILPSNFIVNLRVRQQLFSNTELIFRIENLLNQSYAEQFGNSIADLDYPRPKRTIFFEIRFNNY